jgi:hypothetical protein
MYYSIFGLHPDFGKFCRLLKDIQEQQENEELQYLFGGQVITQMKRIDREKEERLKTLRQIFLASPQNVQDAYDYVIKVAFKMRRYNMAGNDFDFDDA